MARFLTAYSPNSRATSERRWLFLAASASTALGSVAAIVTPSRAVAAKLSRRDLFYQDEPRDGKRWTDCRQFTPSALDATAHDTGTCAVVQGEVSANAWCMAYSPRRSR